MNVRRIRRRVFAVAAALAMLGSVAFASAEEVVLEPATEQLYISAGCPPSTPGTCTSTRWLGKKTGDATSNFLTSTTPVDEVFYQAEGSLNWRDYTSDDSLLAEGYPLRGGENLVQTLRLEAKGPAVQNTVHVRIDAFTETGEDVFFEEQKQTVNMLPNSSQTLTFNFPIAEELDGVALDSMTVWVAMHGANVSAGQIDQQGGSVLTIPYWVPAEPVEPTP